LEFIMKYQLAFVVIVVLFAFRNSAADDPASKSDTPPAAQPAAQAREAAPFSKEELEKKFADTLNNVQLIGHFTSNRDTAGAPLKEDKYTIESVKKLTGDLWLFTARIQYGGHDATVPLPLKVLWAGDTPVITVDKMPFPGLGSYTARVLIYDNKYVGTWDGANHGGTLFGKIVKADAKDTEKDTAKDAAKDSK
jgi:hypothetical protein